ncbi:MAG: type III-B CRISPR module-associated protein Cmr5 [Verrucomicrobiota bacterium]
MKNLAQVRAASALNFATSPVEKRGKDGGDAIKKVPPMIAANGLLAALAFSLEARKEGLQRAGYAAIFDAIASHLQSPEILITNGTNNATALLNHLVKTDSQILKLATAEAMEWLSYARRFVRPE